jgi:hypothetical protein
MAFSLVINNYSAVIAASGSLSAAVPMGADTLVGIWMPGTWVSASLTFQVSPDGGTTWVELYNDSGSAVTITGAANQFIALVTNANYAWRGINMLKVRSGTSGSPVVQTGGATVTLIGRPETF